MEEIGLEVRGGSVPGGAAFLRIEVDFNASDGTRLSGALYTPADNTVGPRAAIVMSHGFAALTAHFLERFAEDFAAAGFIVLVYDHRNFGGSGGAPRHEIDPWQQIRDTRDAITWLTLQPGVDGARVGLWGSSYSGGHALVLGAVDRRIGCVVAQVPTISGYEQSLRRVRPDAIAAAREAYVRDREARYRGEEPAVRRVVPDLPGGAAVYEGADARAFYLHVRGDLPEAAWPNMVTVRSLEFASEYEPGIYVTRVTPTPLLMIVAEHDDVTPTDLALKAYGEAREPKRLVLLRGGHFSPYMEKFEEAAGAALEWFRTHLLR